MVSFRWFSCFFTAIVAAGLFPPAVTMAADQSERFYVGTRVCQQCHSATETGDQFGIWQRSAHARSYAVLAKGNSNLIVRLSGLEEQPYDAPVCLGCHTTASDTRDWQRSKGFLFEEGIQCEYCHGPGSDYANWETMADPSAARQAGLTIPDENFCLTCHQHKGSHQATENGSTVTFHHPEKGKVYFNTTQAMAAIRHGGTPESASRTIPPQAAEKNGRARYLGVTACAPCHGEKSDGKETSLWRLDNHFLAFSALTTPKAQAIARQKALQEKPEQSPECLRCHSTLLYQDTAEDPTGPRQSDGVQCESCHGPAGYSALKKNENGHPPLKPVEEDTCRQCHNGYHGQPFDFASSIARLNHPKASTPESDHSNITYKTPFNLTLNRAGTRLYAACEASDSLLIIDTDTRTVIDEIRVMNLPHGITLSPDEKTAYVSNRGSDTISVIDLKSRKVTAAIAVGDEPHDMETSNDGRILVVANTGSHDISIVDTIQQREIKRLSGGRGTWAVAKQPDNKGFTLTNNLSHFVPFRHSSRSELTMIDGATMTVKRRIMVDDANLIQGIDYAASGEFGLVTLLRTKNLLPIVRVLQGWMITNGIGVLWPDGRVDQLLIDSVDNHFADPTDVVITPDSRYAYISGGGVNEVAVIDLQRMKNLLEKSLPEERKNVLPNHLGVSSQYVIARISVGNGPRGLATDGRFVYVADALDDAISVIDITSQQRIATIDLGGPETITQVRRGERIFHSADITYGRQYSCHSCHPDGGIDGLAYDISADGLGFNPVDNRTLRGVLDTAPFKWTGKNVSLSRQCGPRLAVFFTRLDPFTPEQARDLESYICTIARNPNRFSREDGLTESEQRGKLLFFRSKTNDGRVIPEKDRCSTCHSGPYFTNRQKNDVGTSSEFDTHGVFDVPHLNNIYETAPYLHDGRAATLEEIWTVFNPDDKHGVTNDMTKDQLNDLILYLKTL